MNDYEGRYDWSHVSDEILFNLERSAREYAYLWRQLQDVHYEMRVRGIPIPSAPSTTKLITFVLLLLLAFASGAHAADATVGCHVSGTIADSDGVSPARIATTLTPAPSNPKTLKQFTVVVKYTPGSLARNTPGKWTITGLGIGIWTLTIRSDGYEAATKQVLLLSEDMEPPLVVLVIKRNKGGGK